MQKRLHRYMILLLLGFFLLPGWTYACGTQSEKQCCKKETTAKTEKKACCKETHSSTENKGCQGKCGHANCTSAAVNSIVAIFSYFEFTTNVFDFTSEKQKFHHLKTAVLAGFSSVWLIPKIG